MLQQYEINLEKEHKKNELNNVREKVKEFYINNLDYCKKAHSNYKEYEGDKEKFIEKKGWIDIGELKSIVGAKVVLVITANRIEEAIFIYNAYKSCTSKLASYDVVGNTYQLFWMNDVCIIHQCVRGTGEKLVCRAINNLANIIEISHIVLLGVCYGIDYNKHQLGMTFIPDFVTAVRINFRDGKDIGYILQPEIENRGIPSRKIINNIKRYFAYYQVVYDYEIKEKVRIAPLFGDCLSINSLMSNTGVKRSLVEKFKITKIIGGEMEAGGLLESDLYRLNDFNNWLIIKSFCDWGEDKNNLHRDEYKSEEIKDSIQAFAATNSWAVFREIIEKKLIFL